MDWTSRLFVLAGSMGLAASVALAPSSATAKNTLPSQLQVDKMFQRKLGSDELPLVIGLIAGEQTAIYSHGKMSPLSARRPDGDSIFPIGSVSKVFTGLLLAQMVESHHLSLSAPVENYVPAGVIVPTYKRHKITLLHLATHSSGLPAEVLPLGTSDRMYRFLSSYHLNRRPGVCARYSNTGAGLLGLLLVRSAGAKSYDDLLVSRICAPLAMTSTRARLDADLAAKLPQTYDKKSGRRIVMRTNCDPTDSSPYAGSGGIYTTGNDMLKFLAAYLDPAKTPFESAIRLSYKKHFQGHSVTYGLYWNVSDEQGSICKGGYLPGYQSLVILFPHRRVAAFIFMTEGTVQSKISMKEKIFRTLVTRLLKRVEFPEIHEIRQSGQDGFANIEGAIQ